jgi:hypothetical protein
VAAPSQNIHQAVEEQVASQSFQLILHACNKVNFQAHPTCEIDQYWPAKMAWPSNIGKEISFTYFGEGSGPYPTITPNGLSQIDISWSAP